METDRISKFDSAFVRQVSNLCRYLILEVFKDQERFFDFKQALVRICNHFDDLPEGFDFGKHLEKWAKDSL